MPRNPSFFYWDSCVFLSYINGIEDRLQQIEDVWAEIAEDDEKRIVTSAISVAEVAYLITEKEQGRLDPNVETSINAMWYNPSVSLVEVSPPISFLARKLMRDVVPNGWVLKPHDAIHLATAMWVHQNVGPVIEFHTYDDPLHKYEPMIEIQICEPHVLQPKLIRE